MILNETEQSICYSISKKNIFGRQLQQEFTAKGEFSIQNTWFVKAKISGEGQKCYRTKHSIKDIETIITIQPDKKSKLGFKNIQYNGSYCLSIWIGTRIQIKEPLITNLTRIQIKEPLITNLKLQNKKDGYLKVNKNKQCENVEVFQELTFEPPIHCIQNIQTSTKAFEFGIFGIFYEIRDKGNTIRYFWKFRESLDSFHKWMNVSSLITKQEVMEIIWQKKIFVQIYKKRRSAEIFENFLIIVCIIMFLSKYQNNLKKIENIQKYFSKIQYGVINIREKI